MNTSRPHNGVFSEKGNFIFKQRCKYFGNTWDYKIIFSINKIDFKV